MPNLDLGLTVRSITVSKLKARLLRKKVTTTWGGDPQEGGSLPAPLPGDKADSAKAGQDNSSKPEEGPNALLDIASAEPLSTKAPDQPPAALLGGSVAEEPTSDHEDKATKREPSTHESPRASLAEQLQDASSIHGIQAGSQKPEDSSAEKEALALEAEASKLEQQAKALRQQAAALRASQVTSRKLVSGLLRGSINKGDAVILVMGGIGTGKSTFINTLMGQDEIDVGHSLESHTESVTPYEIYLADGSRVVVVDTPGFGDTYKSELEILEVIVTWLSKLYDESIRLTGIVFFHRISDNRMAGSSLRNFHLLRALSGDDADPYITLATSMWDIVDKDLANRRQKDIEDNFWKPAIDNHARLARFSPTATSAQEIIKMFDLKSRVVMQIQREIIEKRLRLSETAAGSIISSRLAQLEQEQLKELEAAREELARAREQGNQGMSRVATEELERLIELRAELEASQRRLKEQKAINLKVFGRFKPRALRNWFARRQNSAET